MLFLVAGLFPLIGNLGLVSFLLLAVLNTFFGLNYYYLMNAMPRTGGDYVYGSRILHPAYGLSVSFVYATFGSSIFLAGSYVYFVQQYIAPFLAGYGLALNDPRLSQAATALSEVGYAVPLGLALVLVGVALVAIGPSAWVRLVRVFFVVSTLGFLALIIGLAIVPQSTFVAAFNSYAVASGTSYDKVIETARGLGFPSTLAPADVTPFVFGFFLLLVTFGTVAFAPVAGSEVKNVKKSAFVGIVVSMYVATAFIAATWYFANQAFGSEFHHALAWLAIFHPEKYPFSVPPNILFFEFAILYPNPAILMFMFVAWLTSVLTYTSALAFQISRTIFAWSFDRLIPEWAAKISDRFHSPVNALIIVFVIVLALTPLYLFTNWVTLFATVSIFCYAGSFLFSALAGVLLPLRKGLFSTAPPFVRRKIGRVPLVCIFGGITFALLLYSIISYNVTPQLAMPIPPEGIAIVIAVYLLPVIMYYIVKWYRKSRDRIDISVAFKEIPPE